MPIMKYFAVAGSALLVLLFVSDALFGDDGSARFDGSFYESALYAPRLQQQAAAEEVRFTRDAGPADRIREVFAQFTPNDGRRGRRSSTAVTFIR